MALEEQGDWYPKVGEIIGNRWRVVEKLGQGYSRAIYEVNDQNGGAAATCKVEHVDAICHTLTWEVLAIRNLTKAGAVHSPRFLDCGRSPNNDYVFLCRTMVGQNLEMLRETLPERKFTLRTSMHIAMETLQGIRELHDAGLIHRDIKPENFAIGRPLDTKRMFMMGLGRVREWRSAQGVPFRPREAAPFRGNINYASVNALRQQEQGRCDDLWAWYYKVIDLTSGSLPWPPLEGAGIYEKLRNAAIAKDRINRELGTLTQNAPKEFQEIQSYLLTLRYESDPDYDQINDILKGICAREGWSSNEPLDWEEGGKYVHQMQTVPYDNRCWL